MTGTLFVVHQRIVQLLGLLLTLSGANVVAVERNIAHTNWTDRWITNDIEVRMPRNVFVDLYHTNWLDQYLTNVVDVYATNWTTENRTNVIPVEASKTVRFTEYKTNWNIMNLTNEIPVLASRTNFVSQWQTNWRTLTVTNWETVLVMKTNWITQPLTNVVQIDLITNRVASTPPVASNSPVQTAISRVESVPAAPAPVLTDSLVVEAARTSRVSANRLAEVRLLVRWSGEAAPLEVEQWRVESENGAILCSAQDQEFRRELPLGRYSVAVKVRRDTGSALLVAKSTLLVTAADATILSRTAALR